MGFEWEDAAGIVVVGLLIIAWGVTIASIGTIVGFDVLATGESTVGYLAAGNFSVGVLSTGIFSVGILAAGIFAIGNFRSAYLHSEAMRLNCWPCNGIAKPHSHLRYEEDEPNNDCDVI